jgi:hypothetical protein
MEPLSDDFIKSLKAKPERKQTRRTKKNDPSDRSIMNWFRQLHHLSSEETQCNFCPRVRMTTQLPSGKFICRYCWLEGMGLPSDRDN